MFGIVSAVKGGSGIARESRECRIWVEFGAGEEVKITFCQLGHWAAKHYITRIHHLGIDKTVIDIENCIRI